MTRLERIIHKCFDKTDHVFASDRVTMMYDPLGVFGFNVEANLVREGSKKIVWEVDVRLGFNQLSHFIEAFNLTSKQDFLALERRQVYEQFKSAAAATNALHFSKESSVYSYYRSRAAGLSFVGNDRVPYLEIPLTTSNFRKLSDYASHCDRYHNKVSVVK